MDDFYKSGLKDALNLPTPAAFGRQRKIGDSTKSKLELSTRYLAFRGWPWNVNSDLGEQETASRIAGRRKDPHFLLCLYVLTNLTKQSTIALDLGNEVRRVSPADPRKRRKLPIPEEEYVYGCDRSDKLYLVRSIHNETGINLHSLNCAVAKKRLTRLWLVQVCQPPCWHWRPFFFKEPYALGLAYHVTWCRWLCSKNRALGSQATSR